MSELLKIENLSKCYGKNSIIKSLNLVIEKDEIFFLLGPSGCGKSTLLRIIAGLLDINSGNLILENQNITDALPEKRSTAMVFQNYALWPHLSVFENVAFGLKVAKVKKEIITKEVMNLLKIVELDGFENRMISSLSGGQQQRVALARALAVSPKLLLLDEPLSNLDSKLRENMRSEIKRIIKNRKLSAMYVTHDRNEALAIADRVAIMDKGEIIQIGSPKQLYKEPNCKFVALFLGGCNFIDGEIIDIKETDITIKTALGNLVANKSKNLNLTLQDKITLGFRPEDAKIVKDNSGDNVLEVECLNYTFMGDHADYDFKANSGDIFQVSASPAIEVEKETKLLLKIDKENLMVLKG